MALVGRDRCIDHHKIDIDLQALIRNLAGEKGRCANRDRSEDNEAFHSARSIPQGGPMVISGGGLHAHMDIAPAGLCAFDNRQSPSIG